jgi:plastocyanin
MRRRVIRLLAALPLLSLAAVNGDAARIAIDNFTFGAGILTIAAGTKVVWTNQDDIPHTVTSADGRDLRSGALDSGDSFAFEFGKPGNYRYFCSLHPKMRGIVVVQ